MCVQPRSSGQGCLLVATEVLVPLTFPSWPFEPLSPGSWRAQQGRFHADGLLLPVAVATALGASRSEAGGPGSRIVSPRSSPRALGTSNPALLHFRPPRSTEELSNDQLSGSE
ncbi:unnamed protein product [Coccothraustes coccothraustes]